MLLREQFEVDLAVADLAGERADDDDARALHRDAQHVDDGGGGCR
jgi:hypothetical protein